MAKVLAMFPGQGSQYVGMGRELLEHFPTAKETFEEASDTLAVDIRKLCLEAPEHDLNLTANTQPCILTISTAIWRVLKQETGFSPTLFAGHSLGEYSALVASEKLAFDRACFLVRRRGEAMQEAVPEGVGAMAAVLNCEAQELEKRCKGISNEDQRVEIANYNSPQQLVVAGHKGAVTALCQKLEADRIRFVVLPVSAPFHSSLMVKAKEAMRPLLEDTEILKNDQAVIANLTGVSESDYSVNNLIEQIDHAVLWTTSMATAKASGCDAYVEIGPGKVLFGLARRCLPKGLKILATDDTRKSISELNALG